MRGEQTWDERVAEAPEMLGQAPAMQDMFRAIGRLSHSAATVLITGESGTGKELVARALHRHSPRASGPFIALNTAAIPKDLLESELFGHERGAFTGAQAMRQGRFEQAENGTLFLDEIGDMPFDLQTRLLRVLSDGQFYRVGGHNPLRANVRVIAATHQNLEARVRQGLFREDLYHRLNVIRLRLPALRERSEDIPLLTRHFLQKSARDLGVEPKRVSDEALAYLTSLPFPGNVRQLENLANWLTVMAPAQTIEIKDLPPDLVSTQQTPVDAASVVAAGAGGMEMAAVNGAGSTGAALAAGGVVLAPGVASAAVPSTASAWEGGLRTEVARLLRENSPDVMDELSRRFEAAVIREALDFTRGRKVEAAERLGIGRNTITRKIQELNLEP
jgi:two-component system nitrogen regulation response regulator GlnG